MSNTETLPGQDAPHAADPSAPARASASAAAASRHPLPARSAAAATRVGWRLVLINAVIVTLLAALLAMSLLASRAHHVERARYATGNTVRALTDSISAEIERIDLALQAVTLAFAREPTRALATHSRLALAIGDLEALVPEVDGLRVVDRDGVLRLGHRPLTASPPFIADREFFGRALHGNGLAVSEPVAGRDDGRYFILIARPLLLADGTPAGVVFGSLGSDYFHNLFRNVGLEHNAAISLRSLKLSLIARSTGGDESTAANALGRADVSVQLRQALANDPREGTYVAITSLDQIERVNSYKRVYQYPLYVIAGRSTQEFLAPWRREAARTVSLGLLLAGVLVAGSWLVHGASRRAHRLQDEIARGREQAENSERFLRNLTEALPLSISYVDRDLRFRFSNRAHAERLGRPREQIIGRTRGEVLGEQDSPSLSARADLVLGGRAQSFEIDEAIGDKVRRFESRMTPHVAIDGSVQGFFTVSIDITERSANERALRELTAILENTPDLVVQTDWRGNVTFANAAARRALHMGLASLSTRNLAEFIPAETNHLLMNVIVPAVQEKGIWVGDSSVALPGGRVLPVSNLVIAHRDDSGRVSRYSSVMRDISDQVDARRENTRQTATLRSVAESMPAVVAVVGADLRYRFVNTAFERWIGLPRDRVVGRTVREVIGASDQERSQPWIDRALAGETVSFERTHTMGGQASHLAVTYVPMWTDGGQVDGFVAALHDISQHRQEQVRLLQLSQVDALTGLLNRAGLEQALADRVRDGGGGSIAALYIDLDRFKPVNDQHGHPVGDELLKAFAQRLRSLVRPSDVVARMGGDEFVVLLAGVREAAHAEAVATKIVEATRVPFNVGELRLSIGACVGVACGAADGSRDGGSDVERGRDLLARADAMLYRAKNSGRSTHAAERH